MINPVTLWFKIMGFNDKHAIIMANLVETTWITRYPWPKEIAYYQGSEFIGHEFRKYRIEEIMLQD